MALFVGIFPPTADGPKMVKFISDCFWKDDKMLRDLRLEPTEHHTVFVYGKDGETVPPAARAKLLKCLNYKKFVSGKMVSLIKATPARIKGQLEKDRDLFKVFINNVPPSPAEFSPVDFEAELNTILEDPSAVERVWHTPGSKTAVVSMNNTADVTNLITYSEKHSLSYDVSPYRKPVRTWAVQYRIKDFLNEYGADKKAFQDVLKSRKDSYTEKQIVIDGTDPKRITCLLFREKEARDEFREALRNVGSFYTLVRIPASEQNAINLKEQRTRQVVLPAVQQIHAAAVRSSIEAMGIGISEINYAPKKGTVGSSSSISDHVTVFATLAEARYATFLVDAGFVVVDTTSYVVLPYQPVSRRYAPAAAPSVPSAPPARPPRIPLRAAVRRRITLEMIRTEDNPWAESVLRSKLIRWLCADATYEQRAVEEASISTLYGAVTGVPADRTALLKSDRREEEAAKKNSYLQRVKDTLSVGTSHMLVAAEEEYVNQGLRPEVRDAENPRIEVPAASEESGPSAARETGITLKTFTDEEVEKIAKDLTYRRFGDREFRRTLIGTRTDATKIKYVFETLKNEFPGDELPPLQWPAVLTEEIRKEFELYKQGNYTWRAESMKIRREAKVSQEQLEENRKKKQDENRKKRLKESAARNAQKPRDWDQLGSDRKKVNKPLKEGRPMNVKVAHGETDDPILMGDAQLEKYLRRTDITDIQRGTAQAEEDRRLRIKRSKALVVQENEEVDPSLIVYNSVDGTHSVIDDLLQDEAVPQKRKDGLLKIKARVKERHQENGKANPRYSREKDISDRRRLFLNVLKEPRSSVAEPVQSTEVESSRASEPVPQAAASTEPLVNNWQFISDSSNTATQADAAEAPNWFGELTPEQLEDQRLARKEALRRDALTPEQRAKEDQAFEDRQEEKRKEAQRKQEEDEWNRLTPEQQEEKRAQSEIWRIRKKATMLKSARVKQLQRENRERAQATKEASNQAASAKRKIARQPGT